VLEDLLARTTSSAVKGCAAVFHLAALIGIPYSYSSPLAHVRTNVDDTYYGIDTLIKDMLARNRRVGKYLCHDYWVDIGQLHDYEAAQKEYGNHFTHLD
jgi:NDP-sugar pyrophosphorylase family protein